MSPQVSEAALTTLANGVLAEAGQPSTDVRAFVSEHERVMREESDS